MDFVLMDFKRPCGFPLVRAEWAFVGANVSVNALDMDAKPSCRLGFVLAGLPRTNRALDLPVSLLVSS